MKIIVSKSSLEDAVKKTSVNPRNYTANTDTATADTALY